MWYSKGRHVLGETVTAHRLDLTAQIIRHRLRIIPAQRGPMLKEDSPPYISSTERHDPITAREIVPAPDPPLDATRNTQ